jgi:hypothetical protein
VLLPPSRKLLPEYRWRSPRRSRTSQLDIPRERYEPAGEALLTCSSWSDDSPLACPWRVRQGTARQRAGTAAVGHPLSACAQRHPASLGTSAVGDAAAS